MITTLIISESGVSCKQTLPPSLNFAYAPETSESEHCDK